MAFFVTFLCTSKQMGLIHHLSDGCHPFMNGR